MTCNNSSTKRLCHHQLFYKIFTFPSPAPSGIDITSGYSTPIIIHGDVCFVTKHCLTFTNSRAIIDSENDSSTEGLKEAIDLSSRLRIHNKLFYFSTCLASRSPFTEHFFFRQHFLTFNAFKLCFLVLHSNRCITR